MYKYWGGLRQHWGSGCGADSAMFVMDSSESNTWGVFIVRQARCLIFVTQVRTHQTQSFPLETHSCVFGTHFVRSPVRKARRKERKASMALAINDCTRSSNTRGQMLWPVCQRPVHFHHSHPSPLFCTGAHAPSHTRWWLMTILTWPILAGLGSFFLLPSRVCYSEMSPCSTLI